MTSQLVDADLVAMPIEPSPDSSEETLSDQESPLEDTTTLTVESSWHSQPIRLPAYTPSTAASQTPQASPPTTPIDDPIHSTGSNKHFGFSARKSIASAIMPWQKHKPVVYHQYAPHRPPISRRSSLSKLKILPVAAPDAVKHLDTEELDLMALKEEGLGRRTLELMHLLQMPEWIDVTDHTLLEFERISGAMTNCIYVVSGPPLLAVAGLGIDAQVPTAAATAGIPRKVLLRVYGVGTETLFSRDRELFWLQKLSMMDIGPSLLGIFKNGRFEQYVDSTTLTKEDIRDPRTSRHIAHRMCELHNLVNVFPPNEGCVPQSMENIKKWTPLAREAIIKIYAKHPDKRAELAAFDFEKFLVEVDEIHRELTAVHTPLVFAHNDTQYGNILRTRDGTGELVVIDFEYAGYNTRGFDIGNHFCEWTADYHSERASLMHPSKYPTKEEQLNFLEAYMEAEIAITGHHLTAINISKYEKRRRSITSTLASGLARAFSTLGRKASVEGLARDSSIAVAGSTATQENVNMAVPVEGTAEAKALAAAAGAEAELVGSLVTEVAAPPSPMSLSGKGAVTTITTPSTAKGQLSIDTTSLSNQKQTADVTETKSRSSRRKHAEDGAVGVSKAEILDSMYKEVNKFALTSHIMWGLWGLIQATQSEIEFDYVEYALQRLNEFRRRRDEFMSL